MMSDIKLLVLDIDGTISGRSNGVSEPVKQAVQAVQAQGIRVAIATGRMYRSAKRFHREIGSDLPLICYQGAWIADPQTDVRLRHTPLSQSIALELIELLAEPEWSSLSVHCYIDDRLIVNDFSADTQAYVARSQIQPEVIPDLAAFIAQNVPTKLLALSADTDRITRLLHHVRDRYHPDDLYLTTSTPHFFEATHPQANKGTAVQYLAEEYLGLCADQVMAIGDNYNDLEMLIYAGIGVAMGDAPSGVSDRADWVAPSVEADGVAAAIERFILNRDQIAV
ncbi:MAG: HAD family phosphatase [Oscillatoriales cyanobacterium]|nr:MAG: HAD family phosphatase [Oscillatoriales cyanobacterium]